MWRRDTHSESPRSGPPCFAKCNRGRRDWSRSNPGQLFHRHQTTCGIAGRFWKKPNVRAPRRRVANRLRDKFFDIFQSACSLSALDSWTAPQTFSICEFNSSFLKLRSRAGERAAHRGGGHRRTAPGGVDMQPQPGRRAIAAQRPSGSTIPALVVPAVAATIAGTRPAARSSPIGRPAPPCPSVPCRRWRQAHRVAADARLMRDLEPGEVAVARHIKDRRRRQKRERPWPRNRLGPGQRAEQRRVVGLRAAGREMPGRSFRKAGAARRRRGSYTPRSRPRPATWSRSRAAG